MFRVRHEHAQALRPALDGALPDRILQGLRQEGLQAEREPGSGAIVATDARGSRTRLSFSSDGSPREATLPSGARFGFEGGSDGRLSAVTFPSGERVDLGYDERGDITSLTRPGLLAYTLGYDEERRLSRVTYPDGSSTLLHHGPAGLERVVDRTGAATTYSRDDAGGRHTVTDTLGRATTFFTGARGRLDRILFPDGSEQHIERSEEGHPLGVRRRDGQRVAYERDETGRVAALRWPDGERTEVGLVEKDGAVVTLKNATGTLILTFAEDGTLRSEQTPAGALEYGHDEEGRLTELRTPWGDRITYRYDVDGRLEAVRDWDGKEIRFGYTPDGAISSIDYGGEVRELREYARLGAMARATVVDGQGYTLSEQTYDYDICERLVGMTDAWGAHAGDVERRRFVVDAEGHLLAEIDPATERVLAEYDYDAKGNLTLDDGRRVHVGVMDEPISYDGREIGYDGCGNMLRSPAPTGGERLCSFGGDGRLREVVTGDRRVRFTYDALGRRVSKAVGHSLWRYGWAGCQLLWEEHIPHPGATPVRRDYLYHPDGITPLAFREGGKTYWMQTDPRRAVIRVFDGSGNVVWRARYESFGRARVAVGLVRQPLRLAGQYEDEETGLHYNVARYYCPWLKSYLSLDPSWSHAGATNYAFARNDPWNKADATGGLAFLAVVGIIALGAVIGAAVGAVAAYFGHGDILAAALGGAVEGAFAAAGTLAGMAIGQPILGALAGDFIGATLGSALEQWMTTGDVCWTCALRAGATSVIVSLITAGLGKIPGVKQVFSAALDQVRKLITAHVPASWIAKIAARNSPVPIPDNAAINAQAKGGYLQIRYTWSDGTYRFESRWHTRTPGAPAGQGNTWVVTRTTPGTPTGQKKVQHVLTGENEWTPTHVWQAAVKANQDGTATEAQKDLLKRGHWPAP
ncbi:uncharacterized protein SOCEGT47_072880 [Sorangium cellulosum]|uniref:Teneurin-like YD-shell domain-containing protein n=1 Tax=Sorangium cellulosum TaxID=56 RepID=A0A4P2QBM2_SORCE|nr:RHS repeat-associated core domain-containing protein [Sorangium cellulosum]AUX26718.1 uncharacterized protein SOCEGT47_072880 [Sorangium cellulosum]